MIGNTGMIDAHHSVQLAVEAAVAQIAVDEPVLMCVQRITTNNRQFTIVITGMVKARTEEGAVS